ncbi:DHS-like NAD/FAD-binding domain-containing protein [Pavlovales sp. CCMP2436]|nr:DHS-like NAD/FAD-binding domain-containing protein [Pavlovales sp. CCMP2436]
MSTYESTKVPELSQQAVLMASEEMPSGSLPVKGYDFNQGVDFEKLMASYLTTGFQANQFALAVNEVRKMRAWRLSDEPIEEDERDDLRDPAVRARTKATIFLGFTSNLISAGTRESIKYLCQHKLVDVIVTTGGGIEEDLMKCMAPHYIGDFALKGAELRRRGINRIGNLLVPNRNYCIFEEWLMPILDEMLEEQNSEGTRWTPSKMIKLLGERIGNEDSVYYWAAKNGIPVFCPAITDGSVGDMLYFHSYKNPGLVLDIVEDIREINNAALHASHSGMLILGGGLVKHHICNANLMRNGADFAVFINTGQEFDGSDSGAKPDEAISWGKIKPEATPVKVYSDATLLLPLLVALAFVDPKPDGTDGGPTLPGASS